MENINEMANIPFLGQRFRNHYGVFIPDNYGKYRIHKFDKDDTVWCDFLNSPGALRKLNILPNGLLTRFRLKPALYYRRWQEVFVPARASYKHRIKITGKFPNFYHPDGRQLWMTPKWLQPQPYDYIAAMMMIRKDSMYRSIYKKRQPELTCIINARSDGFAEWRVFIDGVFHSEGIQSDVRSAEAVARFSLGARSDNARRLTFTYSG